MPHDVVCLGEVMVELALNDATPDTAGIGFAGDTFNTSVYLKRSAPSLDVAYATKLGRDRLSDRIVALMQREALATDLVLRSPDRMPGLYAISTDASTGATARRCAPCSSPPRWTSRRSTAPVCSTSRPSPWRS